jgi:hypothetical protein
MLLTILQFKKFTDDYQSSSETHQEKQEEEEEEEEEERRSRKVGRCAHLGGARLPGEKPGKHCHSRGCDFSTRTYKRQLRH